MRSLLPVLAVVGLLVAGLDVTPAWAPSTVPPVHHVRHGFKNLSATYDYPLFKRTVRAVQRGFQPAPARGTPPAILANDGAYVRSNGHEPTVTWIGHATLLFQIGGLNVLSDPIWSERASPVRFAGPRRMVPPGIRFEDLPRIHAVVISHDHYDHLDAATVRRLAREHNPRFFVPLGIKAWLAGEGIQDAVELDWGESSQLHGVTFVATPSQHSSGRGLRDQNRRLWASWVIAGGGRRVFFAGDTGYDARMADIGRQFGPFDVTALPIGGYMGYGSGGHPNHINPEEAVQLFQDLGGRLLVPMHFATYNMNREPFAEPPGRLLREARRCGIEDRVAILRHGEMIHIGGSNKTKTVPWP